MPQYASKYYDPVKAHEYYEEHKKLKGRHAAHNTSINDQINKLQNEMQNAKPKRKEQIRDEIQKLREQIKGGSTSGFNTKGMEAAMYIQKQIEEEREQVTKDVNRSLDNEMLNSIKKLADEIEKDRFLDNRSMYARFSSKLAALVGETRKKKMELHTARVKEYKEKYEDEIDKLRGDTSVYSYYDRKNARKNARKKK